MEQEAEREVEGDAEPGVVQRVEPFEGRRLEDRDEAVDGHRDDDVHGADTEGVGEGPLDVSLLEGVSTQSKDLSMSPCRRQWSSRPLQLPGRCSRGRGWP